MKTAINILWALVLIANIAHFFFYMKILWHSGSLPIIPKDLSASGWALVHFAVEFLISMHCCSECPVEATYTWISLTQAVIAVV